MREIADARTAWAQRWGGNGADVLGFRIVITAYDASTRVLSLDITESGKVGARATLIYDPDQRVIVSPTVQNRMRGLDSRLAAVAVNRVFDDVALLAVEIHDEGLDGQVISLRSARPAAGVDCALHLPLRRNFDHSVVHQQWFRRVRCHEFAVDEANGAAGIVKVKFWIDRLVALHFGAHGHRVNHGAGILRRRDSGRRNRDEGGDNRLSET